jgi:hypothetical protein
MAAAEIRFTDGMHIETGGALRCIHKADGWYVTGRGMLLAVADVEEGQTLIAELKARESRPGQRISRRGGK